MTILNDLRKSIDTCITNKTYDKLFKEQNNTTCYDSTLVTHLICELLNHEYDDIYKNIWYSGTDKGTYGDLFTTLLNVDKSTRKLDIKSKYDFIVCGDFGADHDDIEALIMICNICKAYPDNFKLIGVTSSNVVDSTNKPINSECIKIAKCIVEYILDFTTEVNYYVDNETGKDLNKKIYTQELYSLDYFENDGSSQPKTMTNLNRFLNGIEKSDSILSIIGIASMKIPVDILNHKKTKDKKILVGLMGIYNEYIKPNVNGDNYRFDKESSNDMILYVTTDPHVKSICIGKGLTYDRSKLLNENHICYTHFQKTHQLAILNVVKHWISEENVNTPINKFPMMKHLKVPAFLPLLSHLNGLDKELIIDCLTK